ncbi:MAG: hypothetical protein MRY83_12675, partial [Flavobacteriales bacterium]|nr:hypothetical protein [Flavobacteriales bacterium]
MNTAKTAFIAISLFVYTTLSGQSDFGKVTFQSPNSSDFQMYGNVPVGHYTGVPNISIPLYEVKDASLNVPISLSYHSSSVKVNKHSGWVGLGWTLKAGGVITRIQNQLPDEQESNHTFSPGFYEQHHVLDYPDWYTSANLQDYAIQQSVATGIGSFESAPDEFQFNFLSYSGSFIMDHKGEWKVISDHNIRVEFDETTGFLDAQNLPDRIIDAGYPNLSTVNGSPFHQFNRYFHEFTLITPDGTRYTFGGDNAVEYNVNFRNQLAGYILAQAWYLKKIKGRNGEEIDFVYEEGKLVCALNRSRTYNKVDFNSAPGALSLDCNKTFDNRIAVPEESNIGGTVIFPVYLSQIEAETEIINFHSSPTNDLNYELMNDPNTFYDFWPTCNTSSWQGNCPVYFDFLDWSAFEWVKLDRISVTKKLGGYFKGFNFGYINSPHERLKLTSVQETGKITGPYQYATKPPYEFEYNAEMLPNYLSDDVDHWGFYNGYSAHTWGAAHSNPDILNGWYDINTKYLDLPMSEWAPYYFNSRETWLNGNGDQYAKAEVLERITYPTGGFTEFEFEQNTYSQVVSKDRQSLEMVKTSESQPLATNIVSISRGTCDIYPVLGSPFKGSDLINAKASLEVIRCSNEDYTNSTDPVFSLVLEEVAPGSNIVIDTYNGYQHDDHYINENMALSYFFPGVTGLDPIKTYRIVSPEPITVGPFHPGLRFNVYHEGGIKKAGGLRIKSIKSYPSVSEDPIIKTYDYGQEFAGNIAGSSGILGNKVQYWWDNYTAESTDGDQIEYDYFTSSNQLSPGDNGQGGHIGYSKVTERQEGANGKTLGKTEYQFTNYDQDVWGNYHLDELAINWMDVERSVYAPYSSTSFERGKPIKISWYNNSGDLLKDIKYKYQRSTNDYLRMIDLEEINLCGPGKLPMHFG